MSGDAINLVTLALRRRLEIALTRSTVPGTVFVGPLDDADASGAALILFLYRIVPGGTDRSYGLHVARLAGIPGAVVARAAEILRELETLSPELRRKTSLEGAGQAARPPEPPRVPAPSPSRRRSRRTPAGPGLFDPAG